MKSLCLLSLVLFALRPTLSAEPFSWTIEAENLDHVTRYADTEQASQWKAADRSVASGGTWAVPAAAKEESRDAFQATQPAETTVSIPAAGTYFLWARYAIHPLRAKPFRVALQGHDLVFADAPYGEEASQRPADVYGDKAADENGLVWTRREIRLSAGTAEMTLSLLGPRELSHGVIAHPPGVDAFILTSDPAFRPDR